MDRIRSQSRKFCNYNYNVDGGHSIKVQTHAGRSIAFNMFWTLWPFTFWPKNHTTCKISESHFLYKVWRLWGHSFLSYAADRHSQTGADERFTPATVVDKSRPTHWREVVELAKALVFLSAPRATFRIGNCTSYASYNARLLFLQPEAGSRNRPKRN